MGSTLTHTPYPKNILPIQDNTASLPNLQEVQLFPGNDEIRVDGSFGKGPNFILKDFLI